MVLYRPTLWKALTPPLGRLQIWRLHWLCLDSLPLTPFHSTPTFSFASSTYFHTLTSPSITYLASNSAILCLSTTDEASGRNVFSICPLIFFLVSYSPFCLSSCLLKKYHVFTNNNGFRLWWEQLMIGMGTKRHVLLISDFAMDM